MDGVLCSESFIICCKRVLCLDIYVYPNLSGDFEILLFQKVMFSTIIKYAFHQQFKAVVWFLGNHRSAHPKLSATSSQMIRGHISVMATLKFTFFFN